MIARNKTAERIRVQGGRVGDTSCFCAGTGKNLTVFRLIAGLSVRELQDTFGFATPQAIYK